VPCHRPARASCPPPIPGGWSAALAGVLLVVMMAAAGCGSRAVTGVPQYEVRAQAVPGLGTIIADGQGYTLYMYAPDHQGASQCTGVCARQWPPLLLPPGVTQPKAGPGVDAALLGVVRRSDGTLQETYNRWPLYLWQGDTAPGQATGQADDMGLWYVVSVTGTVDKGIPR
jgi:predicted lipoprotein with Yx(FWY)xxD motif